MISKILPYMRCPRCAGIQLQSIAEGVSCVGCKALYPINTGVLDMMESDTKEVITPFQRLMQTPLVVSIYEKIWRRIGYYIASSRSFAREMETVLQSCRDKSLDRVLDLACGTGIFSRPLAKIAGGYVVGLDMSRPMLAYAQRMVQKERISNMQLIRATAFCMPFADNAFQYINCCGALHLFDKPEAALKEIARVLDINGYLCVQTTIRPARSAGLAYILEKFIRFGFFNETDIVAMMKRQGFEIVESQRHRISFTFLARCKDRDITNRV